MVVLFGQGLRDIIIPNPQVQKIYNKWRLVPEGNKYLIATTNCVVQCSKRFYNHTIFWKQRKDDMPFADCSHDTGKYCQHVH